jgi:hypothetical protein
LGFVVKEAEVVEAVTMLRNHGREEEFARQQKEKCLSQGEPHLQKPGNENGS